jgi:hypothetical protein
VLVVDAEVVEQRLEGGAAVTADRVVDRTVEFLRNVKTHCVLYSGLGTSDSTERLATPLFDSSSLFSRFGAKLSVPP